MGQVSKSRWVPADVQLFHPQQTRAPQQHSPAEKAMKASRFLKLPFSSKKWPGSTSLGFSHWVGSMCTEDNSGIMVVSCGRRDGRGETSAPRHGALLS